MSDGSRPVQLSLTAPLFVPATRPDRFAKDHWTHPRRPDSFVPPNASGRGEALAQFATQPAAPSIRASGQAFQHQMNGLLNTRF